MLLLVLLRIYIDFGYVCNTLIYTRKLIHIYYPYSTYTRCTKYLCMLYISTGVHVCTCIYMCVCMYVSWMVRLTSTLTPSISASALAMQLLS